MTTREFYTAAEAAALLGCDVETVREQIAMNRWPAYIELREQQGWWHCLYDAPVPPTHGHTEFSTWGGRLFDHDNKLWMGGDKNDAGEGTFALSGWFLLDERAARKFALPPASPEASTNEQQQRLKDYMRARSVGAPVQLPDAERAMVSVMLSPVCGHGDASELGLLSWSCKVENQFDAVRLRARDLSSSPNKPLGGWPWGTYETENLRHLASAAKQWWVTFDPDAPGASAPTNNQVAGWLAKEYGVAPRLGNYIATILRDPAVKPGRRPRK